jgi:hypothetical protein
MTTDNADVGPTMGIEPTPGIAVRIVDATAGPNTRRAANFDHLT